MFRALLLCALALPAAAQQVEVVAVYDGDTFTANVPGWPDIVGHRIGVRVKGVDTPELRGQCPEEKRLARRARQYTVALLRSAEVVELREVERDKYFRLLAEVWADGQRLDLMLIQAGLGREYHGGKRRGWCS
ncbi:thermonuclease family protein [Microbulbifer thermotolerans]|uniref:Thermonuclease family protein n=1 Tax=Microbulbifer thermotolerans TaxID=252514 RepID=A0AB35HZP9_MICTH|nr:thermonuclease family protein [Microbulbifer thermotolerans]MCX2802266.1 thermonuclease family protein [Microbulbifer thermotolerans]